MKAKHSLRRESGGRGGNDVHQPAKDAIAPPAEDQIAALAYGFWIERGCPEGCPEEDWFRAKRELAEAPQKDSASNAR
jgi:hypothetical protein